MIPLGACSDPLPTGIPANALSECPPPRVFDGATADDLVTDYLDLLALYRECAAKHRAATQ